MIEYEGILVQKGETMIWNTPYEINSHDVDYNGIATVTAIMRYMQESANIQVREMGPSNESLREKGHAFILSRFSIEIGEPLFAYDKIQSKTWGTGNKRLLFQRCFAIEKDEKVICRAHATMGLLDIPSRKLLTAEHYQAGFTYEENFDPPVDERMTLPKSTEEMTYLGEYRVGYAVVDMNRHMNNTRYADMMLGFVNMDHKWVKHFTIRFAQEAPLHEILQVYGKAEGDVWVFRTLRSDGQLNAEAQFVFGNVGE